MTDRVCALCDEPGAAARPMVVVQVDDPERRWPMQLHASCLTSLLRARLQPYAPGRSAGIPGDAACGVCGERLPIVGRHPYAVTLEQAGEDRTWFLHAQCLPDAMRRRMTRGS